MNAVARPSTAASGIHEGVATHCVYCGKAWSRGAWSLLRAAGTLTEGTTLIELRRCTCSFPVGIAHRLSA